MTLAQILETIAIEATLENPEEALNSLIDFEAGMDDWLMDAEMRQAIEQVITSYQILLNNIIDAQ